MILSALRSRRLLRLNKCLHPARLAAMLSCPIFTCSDVLFISLLFVSARPLASDSACLHDEHIFYILLASLTRVGLACA